MEVVGSMGVVVSGDTFIAFVLSSVELSVFCATELLENTCVDKSINLSVVVTC